MPGEAPGDDHYSCFLILPILTARLLSYLAIQHHPAASCCYLFRSFSFTAFFLPIFFKYKYNCSLYSSIQPRSSQYEAELMVRTRWRVKGSLLLIQLWQTLLTTWTNQSLPFLCPLPVKLGTVPVSEEDYKENVSFG